MTMTENSILRISGPADLLGAVPYLLGFHPQESLVIIGLADRQVVVTARIDLVDIGEQDDHLSDIVGAIVRAGTTKLVGIVYTEIQPDADGPLPHAEVAGGLAREAERLGVEMTDCMVVAGGRWSYTCHDPACCPTGGTALPAAPPRWMRRPPAPA
jgi:hypothetical protein